VSFRVVYDKRALRALDKMDGYTRKLILAYINKHLEGCDDPRAQGKALSGDKAGLWRYRIGDYRVLASIDDGQVTIFVFKIGHRRSINRD
jgi:mRNA interferase RelE/StbE